MHVPSIRKKFLQFCIMLQSFEIAFDTIVLTEIWLDDLGYDIKGYNKFTSVGNCEISNISYGSGENNK